jgi:hypothetical protein
MTTDQQKNRTKRSLMHITIELFFAVLPLIILGAYWPGEGDPHPTSFIRGPEWSMTACILYGLSLARFQIGLSCNVEENAHEKGYTGAVISMLPLLGVILSVIFISKTSHGTVYFGIVLGQLINFVVSIVMFVLLGGYGMRKI